MYFDQYQKDHVSFKTDFSISNEIPPGQESRIGRMFILLDIYHGDKRLIGLPPQYIVFAIKYNDPLMNKNYSQVFFIEWDGIIVNDYPHFNHCEKKQGDSIKEHLKNLLMEFYKLY